MRGNRSEPEHSKLLVLVFSEMPGCGDEESERSRGRGEQCALSLSLAVREESSRRIARWLWRFNFKRSIWRAYRLVVRRSLRVRARGPRERLRIRDAQRAF